MVLNLLSATFVATLAAQGMFGEDLTPEFHFKSAGVVVVATILDPAQETKNAKPPTLSIEVHDVLKGTLAPGTLKARWLPPESGIWCPVGEEKALHRYAEAPLMTPAANSKMILIGHLEQGLLQVSARYRVPFSQERLDWVKACLRDPEAVFAKRMETLALDRLRKNPGAKLAAIENAEGVALLQHLDLLGDVEDLRLGLPVTEKELAALAALPKLKRVTYLYRSDWATALPPVCKALPVTALLPGSGSVELGPDFFIQAGQLKNLEELILADLGKFGDGDAAALARSTSLRKLWTARSAIGPAAIQEFAKIKTLEDFYLSASCRPTEEDFKALGGLERLRSLILGDNVRVTATGLAQLQRIPGLEKLRIDGNGALGDAELEAVSGISTLTELFIWNPSLKDEANLLCLAKLKNLKMLMLALHLAPKARIELVPQLKAKLPDCRIR